MARGAEQCLSPDHLVRCSALCCMAVTLCCWRLPCCSTTLEGQLVADTTAFGRPDVAELWHYIAQVRNCRP